LFWIDHMRRPWRIGHDAIQLYAFLALSWGFVLVAYASMLESNAPRWRMWVVLVAGFSFIGLIWTGPFLVISG